MLRITITPGRDGRTRIALEGRLVGAWVDEAERAWNEIAGGGAVTVALDGVDFIDAAGKRLLRRMHAAGARLEASGCMTRATVDQIVREGRPS
jgi:hypothetical protein